MGDEDLLDGDGETGEPVSPSEIEATDDPSLIPQACLSCGNDTIGVFCANCGQKNDDLRRSLFLLARDFIEDTFAFDSRMWRTLGLLAVAPGIVPSQYAHGRRSRHTPPVRLFLVVSFLFFLILSLTQTLFVAVNVSKPIELNIDVPDIASEGAVSVQLDIVPDDIEGVPDKALAALSDDCLINVNLRFFVRARDIDEAGIARWEECADEIRTLVDDSASEALAEGADPAEVSERFALDEEETIQLDKVFSGASRAIADPQAFNAAFNNWLPRVMFLMTPVLALILTVFIRGPDALFFDHMILSIYSHAVGFAIVGGAVIAAQLGVPFVGIAATLALPIYFLTSLKRAYGRGWIKTVWTAFMAAQIYLLVLLAAVTFIVVRIVMT